MSSMHNKTNNQLELSYTPFIITLSSAKKLCGSLVFLIKTEDSLILDGRNMGTSFAFFKNFGSFQDLGKHMSNNCCGAENFRHVYI